MAVTGALKKPLLLRIAAVAVGVFGLGLYRRALTTPPPAADVLGLGIAATAAMAGGLLLWRLAARGGARAPEHLLLLSVALAPAAFLVSVPETIWDRLGPGHPATLAALGFALLLPGALALVATWADDARLRRWLPSALLAAASVIATLLALEAATRLLGIDPGDGPPSFKETRYETIDSPVPRIIWQLAPNQTWKTIYPSNERQYFDTDRSITYRINAQGFRGEDFSPERRPGVRRVVLMGDSFAFGIGVKERDTVAARLARLLSSHASCPVEVLNFGVLGYTTEQEEALLRKRAVFYSPDLVVVWYFINDPHIEGTIDFLGTKKSPLFFPMARHFSALARLLGSRLTTGISLPALVRTYSEAYRRDDPRWQEVEQALQRMGRTSRRRHVPIVLFVHPVLVSLDGHYPFAAEHAQVLEAARAAGLAAYDLLEPFAGRRAEDLWVHRSDQHPNERADAIAAAYAAEKLRALLPRCDRD